jgi:hypothetical protein
MASGVLGSGETAHGLEDKRNAQAAPVLYRRAVYPS